MLSWSSSLHRRGHLLALSIAIDDKGNAKPGKTARQLGTNSPKLGIKGSKDLVILSAVSHRWSWFCIELSVCLFSFHVPVSRGCQTDARLTAFTPPGRSVSNDGQRPSPRIGNALYLANISRFWNGPFKRSIRPTVNIVDVESYTPIQLHLQAQGGPRLSGPQFQSIPLRYQSSTKCLR